MSSKLGTDIAEAVIDRYHDVTDVFEDFRDDGPPPEVGSEGEHALLDAFTHRMRKWAIDELEIWREHAAD